MGAIGGVVVTQQDGNPMLQQTGCCGAPLKIVVYPAVRSPSERPADDAAAQALLRAIQETEKQRRGSH